MMRIYISGPITHHLDTAFLRFGYAEIQIKALGHKPVNPFAISTYLPDDFSHSEFMRVDTVLMELCDGVYFMDGWQDSEGCRIERARAEAWGLAIFDKISEMADRRDT